MSEQAARGRALARQDGRVLWWTGAGVLSGLVYGLCHFEGVYTLPGAGLFGSWLLLTAVFLLTQKKTLKKDAEGLLLTAVSFLLALCGALYDTEGFRLMNLPLILLTQAAGLKRLSGGRSGSSLSAEGLKRELKDSAPDCFRHWGVPLGVFRERFSGEMLSQSLLGVVIALPVGGVILALLFSADRSFLSLVGGRLLGAAGDGRWLWQTALGLGVGLCCFSRLYAAAEGEREREAHGRAVPAPLIVPCLTLLCLIYGAFILYRLRVLGGMAETVGQSPAEYARSGFFQLTIAALITLAVLYMSLVRNGSGAVRGLCALLTALTLGLVALALAAMLRYVSVFGLSVLRMTTLWGIGMIALALLAALARCFNAKIRACRLLALIALISWTALNLLCPARVIARCNIHMAQRPGAEAALDTAYLARLSPSVLPELASIRDDAVRAGAQELARDTLSLYRPAWYNTSLDWLTAELGEE